MGDQQTAGSGPAPFAKVLLLPKACSSRRQVARHHLALPARAQAWHTTLEGLFFDRYRSVTHSCAIRSLLFWETLYTAYVVMAILTLSALYTVK